MARRGRLVCLMGIDGSGKTTQAKLLRDSLAAEGIAAEYVWSRWEPKLLRFATRLVRRGSSGSPQSSGGRVGDRKRRLMSNPAVRSLWMAASLADYALQARTRMLSALGSADIVVCDRYLPDYVVDQAVNTGDAEWTVRNVFGSPLARAFPVPDCVLFVDVTAEVAFSRKDDGIPIPELEVKARAYRHVADALGAVTVPDGSEAAVSAFVLKTVLDRRGDWGVDRADGAGGRRWPRP